MYAQAEKPKENKRQTIANSKSNKSDKKRNFESARNPPWIVAQYKTGSIPQDFSDNRSNAVSTTVSSDMKKCIQRIDEDWETYTNNEATDFSSDSNYEYIPDEEPEAIMHNRDTSKQSHEHKEEEYVSDALRLMNEEENRTKSDSDKQAAIRLAGNIVTRLEYCLDYEGAYTQIWKDSQYRWEDLLNKGNTFLVKCKKVTEEMMDDETDLLNSSTAKKIVYIILTFRKFLQYLEEAEKKVTHELIVTEDASSQQQEVCVRLTKKVAGYKIVVRNFTIPVNLQAKLKPLVESYEPAWNAAQTDGLKGMRFADFKKIALIREAIAEIVIDCNDMDVLAAFSEKLSALASQSCGSRDVQNFYGWYKSHTK